MTKRPNQTSSKSSSKASAEPKKPFLGGRALLQKGFTPAPGMGGSTPAPASPTPTPPTVPDTTLKITKSPLEFIVITNEYGRRIPPKKNASSDHKGIDLGRTVYQEDHGQNPPVYAAHSGTVIRSGFSDSLGNFVIIQDIGAGSGGSGEATCYCHLDSKYYGDVYSGNGQVLVVAGTEIGRMGQTSKTIAVGIHLHLEVYPKSISDSIRVAGKGRANDPNYIGTNAGKSGVNARPYFTDFAVRSAIAQIAQTDPSFKNLSSNQPKTYEESCQNK